MTSKKPAQEEFAGYTVTVPVTFPSHRELIVINMKKELVEPGLITVTQFGNRSHMEKLGLIAHLEVSNYCLTRKAMAFLQGEPIPREVVVKKSAKGKTGASKTVQHSTETCTIHDFMDKGEYWIVPGFEIQEGRVIPKGPNQFHMP